MLARHGFTVYPSEANFLLLDEPTNHLDMQSIQVLIQALQAYEGTYVVVSHDRYFLQQVANKIWYLEDREIREYPGTYEEYEDWQKRREVLEGLEDGTDNCRIRDRFSGSSCKALALRSIVEHSLDWGVGVPRAVQVGKVFADVFRSDGAVVGVEVSEDISCTDRRQSMEFVFEAREVDVWDRDLEHGLDLILEGVSIVVLSDLGLVDKFHGCDLGCIACVGGLRWGNRHVESGAGSQAVVGGNGHDHVEMAVCSSSESCWNAACTGEGLFG